MAKVTSKTHINAPIETVFQYATDLRNAPGRIRGITKMEVLTDGDIGAGTRFRETRVMFGREATEEMEITDFEPPHRFTFDCANHGCKYHIENLLTSSGEGTQMEIVFEVHPVTFMAKLMGFLMRPFLKSCAKETEKDLNDLKAVIEGAASPGESSPQPDGA